MAIDDINNRPKPPAANLDPEVGISSQQASEEEVDTTFEHLKSYMEDMLQFNFGVVLELMGQIAAISPYRPDSTFGKQPEVAAAEASEAVKATPVAPVGEAGAEGYIAGLQYIEGMMGDQDLKVQRMFDLLALSRSGRKPDLENQGLEFERLKSIIIQAEGRMNQMLSVLPETLPAYNAEQLPGLLPEFVDALRQFDGSFREALLEIREEVIRTSR